MSLVPWLYCTALQCIVVCWVENWELQVLAVHHLFSCKWGPVTANENQMRTILQKWSACGPKSALRTSTTAVYGCLPSPYSCIINNFWSKTFTLLFARQNFFFCLKQWFKKPNLPGHKQYKFCGARHLWRMNSRGWELYVVATGTFGIKGANIAGATEAVY